jgi:type IV secretion system protein TrbF
MSSVTILKSAAPPDGSKVDSQHENRYNPYLAARRDWDERYGSLISRARNWRIAAFLALLIAVLEGAVLIRLSLSSRLKTIVVAVDSIGRVVSSGPAEQVPVVDDRLKRAALFQWVQDLRMVTTDPITQRRSIDRVYAMIGNGSSAQNVVTDFYRNNTPFERARTETLIVDVHSIVPTSNRSYEVEWSETTRDHSGEISGTQNWKGVFTIALNPPTDEKLARINPLGIYVIDASWSKVLKGVHHAENHRWTLSDRQFFAGISTTTARCSTDAIGANHSGGK